MSKKTTKRSLLSSVFALVLCVAMLVGATFAWFTDTATTGVNKIVSGKLDVALEMKNSEGEWVNAEGKTLDFVKAEGAENEKILWEPGCTYKLPDLRIVNNGNLALKYKVLITGIQGDAKLNKAITWTIGAAAAGGEQHLAAGAYSEFIIKGHMQETAGNEYQNLSIDGISITVYATQDTVEHDSFNDQYDKDATYYPVLDAAGMKDALLNGGSISVDADIDPDTALVAAKDTVIDMNGNTIANTNDVWDKVPNSWSLVSAQNGADLTITGNGTFKAKENDCYAVDVQDGSTVTIENGTFVGNIHAVYVEQGTAYINGGFYSVQQKYPNAAIADEFVLNCYDANREAGTAKIIVKGGTFVNFNPADCKAEGAGTNFVAPGYSVVSETKDNGETWYTVVKGTGVIPGTQDQLNEAIKSDTNKDVTAVLPSGSDFTLDNGIANEGDKSRNVTFVGDGTQTVDVVTNAVTAEGGELNYQRGSTFTFENVTIQAGEGSFDGIVCDELTYKNCTIKGKLTLYGKATFINCTFENTMADQYSIWTWGGTDVTVDGCTFNTNGKAILLYGRATAEKPTNLTVNNCVFNDRNDGTAGKAAIEIGNDYNATYTLTVNNATVNGFAINVKGENTNTTLWANKNSMDAEHLTVTVDGVKVH